MESVIKDHFQKEIKICKIIMNDVEEDTKNRDGLPFNGEVIGVALGQQAAAIQALARMLAQVMTKLDEL